MSGQKDENFILISEVGPRDGLQNIKQIMPTEAKKRWITALAKAGLKEIEVGSFVPAKILPQLADTAEIVEFARGIDGLEIAVLVPNVRGAENAIKAGAHKITIPLSVSETHSLKNVNRTHAQMLEAVKTISQMVKDVPADRRPSFEGGLSTAFGCTIEGHIPDATILRLAEALMEAGCDEVGLSDTTGFGNPAQVKRLFRETRRVVGAENCTGVHLHNTRGLGLANALAALEEGATTIDASQGGLGGCPFAPGASGNIVTEDLAFMLEAMGLKTGVDIEQLVAARDILTSSIPGVELYGFTPDAGIPLGFAEQKAEAA